MKAAERNASAEGLRSWGRGRQVIFAGAVEGREEAVVRGRCWEAEEKLARQSAREAEDGDERPWRAESGRAWDRVGRIAGCVLRGRLWFNFFCHCKNKKVSLRRGGDDDSDFVGWGGFDFKTDEDGTGRLCCCFRMKWRISHLLLA